MKRRGFIIRTLAALPLLFLSYTRTFFALHTRTPFVVASGQARFGKRFTMRGVTLNTLDIKISGADTDGALAVFEQIGQTPNGGPPLHIHLEQDEWFHVTEGEYLFQCGEERFQLKSGDTIFLPRGVPHAFVQRTGKARTVVSYLPAGRMEEFFAVTDRWTSPPSNEEVARVFAAHGMKVVGEPLRVR